MNLLNHRPETEDRNLSNGPPFKNDEIGGKYCDIIAYITIWYV